jgi:hypothetical protein
MNIEVVRSALLWCTLINWAVLVVWSLLFLLPHDRLYRLWSRWFRIAEERFDTVNFAGIVFYKMGVLLFNLVPYIALRIVG